MTGDRKHITARSPFYRMTPHFNRLNSSTENQIFIGLGDKIGIDNIATCIEKLSIAYYAFLVEPIIENSSNHHSKRIRTEKVESALITIMKEKDPHVILNKQLSCKSFEQGKLMAEEIYADLKKRKVTTFV